MIAIIYGQQKAGKTLAALRAAFGGRIICRPGVLPTGRYGIREEDLRVQRPANLREVLTAMKAATEQIVMVDEMSLFISSMLMAPGADGKAIAAASQLVLAQARRMSNDGRVVVFTAHEAEAWTMTFKTNDKARRIAGGPKLVGQQQSSWTAEADVVIRAQYDADVIGHPWVFQATSSSAWVAGDRHDIFKDGDPMSLWAGWRAAGIKIGPEHPALEARKDIIKVLCDTCLSDMQACRQGMTDWVAANPEKIAGIPERVINAIQFDAWALARHKARG